MLRPLLGQNPEVYRIFQAAEEISSSKLALESMNAVGLVSSRLTELSIDIYLIEIRGVSNKVPRVHG